MSYNQSHLSRRSRRPWKGRASLIALAWCLSWAVVWSAAAQDCYRVVDLGALGFTAGANDTFGINATNQAVFTAEVAGKKHAMLYLPAAAYGLTAGVHDLHTLAGLGAAVESAAHDINDAGIVVGEAGDHAFVWRVKDYTPFVLPPVPSHDLGLFPGGTSSAVFAINNDAPFPIMVGDGNLLFDCACDDDPPFHNLIRRAFALPLEDPPDPLDQAALLVQDSGLPCQPNTFARDVKSQPVLAALTVAGFSAVGGEDCHVPVTCGVGNAATAWINPTVGINAGNALAVLPPGPFGSGGTQAWGVSDTGGAIVGYGYTASNAPCKQHAVYWHTEAADPPLDLGSIAGAGDQSRAERINNNTPPSTTLQVVGWGLAFPTRPLLWECEIECNLLANWDVTEINGSLISPCHFDPPDWEIHKLFDVNNDGSLIGTGSLAGVAHGVVLVPMAECAPAVCQGDIDGDGTVGVSDLLLLVGAWGPCPAPPATCFADLDCDGSVGVSDQNILLANWGPCP